MERRRARLSTRTGSAFHEPNVEGKPPPHQRALLQHLEPWLYLRVVFVEFARQAADGPSRFTSDDPNGPMLEQRILRSGPLRNQLRVIGMRADPEPKDIVAAYFAERSVIQTYSY